MGRTLLDPLRKFSIFQVGQNFLPHVYGGLGNGVLSNNLLCKKGESAWSPNPLELAPCRAVPQPMKSHINYFGALWLDRVGNHSQCR